MQTAAFERELTQSGFDDITTVTVAPGKQVDDHAHGYDVRALVLEGEITLTVGSDSRTYRAGEVFVMDHGREHAETVGADGVRFLVGRRHAAG